MYKNVLLLGLHEEVPLRPDVAEEAEDVHLVPGTDLSEHCVDHDVCAGAADARTAVDDNRSAVWRVCRCRFLYEVQDRQWVVWGAVVGPAGVVVLVYQLFCHCGFFLFNLKELRLRDGMGEKWRRLP